MSLKRVTLDLTPTFMPHFSSGHSHDHGHSHGHNHQVADYGKAFAVGTLLNIAFVIIEAGYGWISGSLALLADAGHNLSDVAGLLLAWAGSMAAKRAASTRHTYGFKKATILASFINAVILLLAMGALMLEAIQRFQLVNEVSGMTVIVVAGIGVLINGITAALFMAGSKDDLNIRGAFLHMAADALVSLGVMASGILYLNFGWDWLDPTVSLIVAAIVIISTWSLFRQSLHLLFDGVPASLDTEQVRQTILHISDVHEVHDLHIWALSTNQNALTAHVVARPSENSSEILLATLNHSLKQKFDIDHCTFQIEPLEFSQDCPQKDCID